ncbi:hypothetical protein OPT61_g3642 [Boeremia exigua]|uniref:Uncharacterized protein n=1 Tax=Boeremia exigua TaxID=749465 RepID=A0ACC2IGZ6_9PLEO|nr:hypothetical protein OPT61_g3642 [Boeremia exigua]
MAAQLWPQNSALSAGISVTGRPLAVDFAANRLPTYHTAFQQPPPYDPIAKSYLVSGSAMQNNSVPSNPQSFWDDVFPDAIARLKTQLEEPKGLRVSKYRIRNKASWTEIQSQLQTARESYIRDVGWLRRSYRVVASNTSQAAFQASRLVPGTDMTSAVVNVIQNLLENIHNATKVHEEILKGFDGMETTIKKIEYSLGMFPHDMPVRSAAVELVATLLNAVERVVSFYEQKVLRKMTAALFRGDEYQENVLQSLSDIQNKTRDLSSQVHESYMLYSSQESRKISRVGRDTNNIARSTDTRTERMENMLADMHNAMLHLMVDHEEEKLRLRKKMQDLEKRNEVLTHSVRSITPTPISGMTWQPNVSNPMLLDSSVTPESLWRLLRVGDELEKVDMEIIADRNESLPWTDRARGGHVVNMDQFKTWMTSPGPSTLLVHGHCVSVGGTTALSLLCSTLTKALRQRSNFLALAYFCGLHEDMDERYYGGVALLQSLIAQLLCQQPFDTRGIQHDVDLAGAEQGQVAGLCQVFAWLAHQLPEETTLVCIIDELAYYERDAAIDETLEVMAYISQLIYNSRLRATIKVLATSTIAVREMREFFPEDSILDMSAVSSTGILDSGEVERELDEFAGVNTEPQRATTQLPRAPDTAPSHTMSNPAAKRLFKEYKALSSDPPEGITAGPVTEDDMFLWEALIQGPEGTPFEGGVFPAELKFPKDYPLAPPKMKFLTDMWHPNVYNNGEVCISILHPPGDDPLQYEQASERWSPIQSVEKILISVMSMLAEPNDESPANIDAAKMWRNQREEYEKVVRQNVKKSLGL